MSNYDAEKNKIRNHLKKLEKIPTLIHEITEIKPLGEGGTSVVYEGRFNNLSVAIKFLAVDLNTCSNDQRVLRFKDEITGLMGLYGKPQFTSLLLFDKIDTGTSSHLYYIMPKLITLKKYVKLKALSHEEINSLIKKLVNNVGILHTQKIIHRDLKPENIFIDADENPVIGDIGIAWFDDEYIKKLAETKKGDRLGNYDFSAPEQAKGAIAAPTMDIYALGQIIQWLITGETHKGTKRKPLATVSTSFSYLDEIVPILIAHTPSDRLQSIEDVKHFFNSIQSPRVDESRDRSNRMMASVEKFDEAIRMSFPVKSGKFTHSKSRYVFKRFFDFLNEHISTISPWFTFENGDNQINKFKKIGWKKWLLGYMEFKVKEIIIYYHQTPYQDFAIIVCKPDRRIGYKETESYDRGEYGFVPIFGKFGFYISGVEFDNGYFEKFGFRFKNPSNTELRVRTFEEKIFIISGMGSSVRDWGSDATVRACILEYIETKNMASFEPLKHLPKHSQI